MKITVTKNSDILNTVDLGDLVFLGEGTSFLIGRSENCHVTLDDQKISREQAQLDYDGKNWSIINLSDYALVLVNGQVVRTKLSLNDGDVVTISDYALDVNIEPVSVPTPIVEEETRTTIDLDQTEIIAGEETDILPPDDIPIHTAVKEETETITVANDESEANPESDYGLDEYGEGQESGEGFGQDEFGDDQYQDGEYDEGYSEEDYGDEAYGDDYAVDGYEDDESTKVFSGFAKFSLELFGEFAPYDTYNIKEKETFIGRDPEKCQIILQDPEVSSVHAVIKKNNITCTIEDLQSANGLILNGKRINSKEISNGDEFVIGGTSFTVRVGSEFIDSQKNMLMPVEENQVVDVEEIVEIDEDDADFDDLEDEAASSSGSKSLFSKEALKDPEKRKKLLIGAVLLIGLWIFLDDSSTQPKEKKENKAKTAKQQTEKKKVDPEVAKLTPEQAAEAESLYQLSKAYLSERKFPEAIRSLDKLFLIKKDFKNAAQLYELAKNKLEEIEKIEEEKRKELARAKLKAEVSELVKKAENAVKERNVGLARSLFDQIKVKDPNNYDVTFLEADLEAWIKEKERKALAEAEKKAERKRMVDALAPGKRLFLKEDWYNAIGALDKFLGLKGMDDDLVVSATDMLKQSKSKLSEVIDPLLGKARSLKEGEDLKGAYRAYSQILNYDPSSIEALNEMDDINTTLTKRARKAYREGLVSESLGLFDEAKEKFQEVQQIAPDDNEYYKKATDRLRSL